MSKLGIITIGQSPRVDLTEDLKAILNKNITIVEKGILDKYTDKEVKDEFSPHQGEKILVSRMKDGSQVILSEEKIIKSIQGCIMELEKHVDMILILCTGKFPDYKHRKPLLIPKEILHGVVSKLTAGKKLGVIVPKDEQVNAITNMWNKSGVEIQIKAASPYEYIEAIKEASKFFKDKDIDYIVLDCMGYSQRTKELVKKHSQKMVILPRTLIGRVINELLV